MLRRASTISVCLCQHGQQTPVRQAWRGWSTCLRSRLGDGGARVRTQAPAGFRNHSFALLRFRPQLPRPSFLTSAFRWKTEAKKRKVRCSRSRKLVAEPGRIILTDCPHPLARSLTVILFWIPLFQPHRTRALVAGLSPILLVPSKVTALQGHLRDKPRIRG